MSWRRVRERRSRLGLTQGALDRLADVPAVYVSLAERGRAPRGAGRAVRLALVREEQSARKRRQDEREQARLEALWAALDSAPEAHEIRRIMADHAWRLLNEAKGEEADRVLELLPRAEARKLLDEYFWDEAAP